MKFDDTLFFTFILPPIIFSAGYNLQKTAFFKYFLYIFLFGVLGTIFSFCIIAPLTYVANEAGYFHFTFIPKSEILHDSTIPRDPHGKILPTTHNDTNHHLRELSEVLKDVMEIPTKDEHPMNNANEDHSKSETPIIIPNKNHTITGNNVTKPNTTEKNPKKKENEVIKFPISDILLFSSFIAATDTVAALTFIDEQKETKLFSILFGEGVINDAVCIVLFRILKEFFDSGQSK